MDEENELIETKTTDQDLFKKPPVTEDDKEEFWKCFLANKPYTERVKLFGGRQTIQFRSLTHAETEDIDAQKVKDYKNGLLKTDENYAYQLLLYRLSLQLLSIDDELVELKPSKASFGPAGDKDNTYLFSRIEAFNDWQAFKLAAYAQSLNYFNLKVTELTELIRDINFYEASE